MSHRVQIHKVAVILMGPPGSGKGTQAELLAKRFGFIHVDTGDYLERILYAPGWRENTVLRHERALFDKGKLCTPEWALEQIRELSKRIAAANWSVVFSGSPRTVFEAFGDERNEGLFSVLSKLYENEFMHVVKLAVKPEVSLERNSTRMKCSMCGLPVLGEAKAERCAFCAGPLMKRSLDDPEVIKVRLKEYQERTAPMFEQMKSRGHALHTISGEGLPFEISEHIRSILKLRKGAV